MRRSVIALLLAAGAEALPCGLPNVGGTCFMNTAIQLMYRTQVFRDVLTDRDMRMAVMAEINEAQDVLSNDLAGKTRDMLLAEHTAAVDSLGRLNAAILDSVRDRLTGDAERDRALVSERRNADPAYTALVNRRGEASVRVGLYDNARKTQDELWLVYRLGDVFREMRSMEVLGDCSADAALRKALRSVRALSRAAQVTVTEHEQEDAQEFAEGVLEIVANHASTRRAGAGVFVEVETSYCTTRSSMVTLAIAAQSDAPVTLAALLGARASDVSASTGDLYMFRAFGAVAVFGIARRDASAPTVKYTTPVDFPLALASPFDPDNLADTYILYGLAVHSGSAAGGHYRAYVKSATEPDVWTRYDDASVTTCATADIRRLGSDVTMLVYVRQGATQNVFPSTIYNQLVLVTDVPYLDALRDVLPADEQAVVEAHIAALERARAPPDGGGGSSGGGSGAPAAPPVPPTPTGVPEPGTPSPEPPTTPGPADGGDAPDPPLDDVIIITPPESRAAMLAPDRWLACLAVVYAVAAVL